MKKMRKFTFIALMIFSSIGLFAQNHGVAPLAKGDMQLNFTTGYTRLGMPMVATFDYAVHKDVTIGGTGGFYFAPGFRVGLIFKGDYHWNYLLGIPNNIDFYTGVRLGVLFGTSFEFDGGIQVGGRYYWNDKWGVNLEVIGSTNFGLNIGVSMKL
jgi:hypothetical protein